jgi:hypothetical protein
MYLNGDFERVISNIHRLAELKHKLGSAFPVICLNSIAFRHHIEKLPDFADLMASIGANAVVVNGLMVQRVSRTLPPRRGVQPTARRSDAGRGSQTCCSPHEIVLSTESFERLSAHDPDGEQAVLSGRASGMLPAKEAIPNLPISGIKAYAQGIAADRPSGNERIKKIVATDGTVRNLVCGAIVTPMEGAYGNQERHPRRFAGEA